MRPSFTRFPFRIRAAAACHATDSESFNPYVKGLLMKLAIGVSLLVVGIVLLIMGVSASESFASDVSRFFTGNPTDRAMWLILGGIAAAVAGLAISFVPGGLLKKR